MIVSTFSTGELTPDQRLHLGYPPAPANPARAPKPVETISDFDLMREKVRVAALAGRLQLLPWLDYHTQETPEMRRAYRPMLKSGVVKSALLGKVFGVGSLELSMNPCQDTDRDRRVAEIVRDCVLDCSGGLPKIALTTLLPALIDGHSVSEKVLGVAEEGPRRGLHVYQRLKGKDTDSGPSVKLVTDEFWNVVGVRPLGFGQAEILPPEKFVIVQYLSLFDSPTGMSDLRAVYSPYWRLDTVRKLRMIHLEKYTSPLLKGTYAPGDIEGKASVERAMQQAKGGTWFSIPEGTQVEALQIAMRGEAEFAKAEQDYTEEIALAISGAFLHMLTARGGGGDMRGDAKTQKGTSELFVWYLAALLAQVISEQMVPDLVRLNFAPGTGRPKAALGDVNDSELAKSAQLDDLLINKLGLDLSRKERMRYYGRTAPVDEADALRKQQPPPQQSPFGSGGQNPFGGGSDSRQFAEPHGGEFARGGGRVPGKGGEARKAERVARKEKRQKAINDLHAAKEAVHGHAKGAEALELALADTWHDHPHVAKVLDLLGDIPDTHFHGVFESRGIPWSEPKTANHRRDELRKLERLADRAVATHQRDTPVSAGKYPEHAEKIEGDRGKVLHVLRRIKVFARQGLRKVDEVRRLQAALKGGTQSFSEPHGGEFAKGGGRVPGKGGKQKPAKKKDYGPGPSADRAAKKLRVARKKQAEAREHAEEGAAAADRLLPATPAEHRALVAGIAADLRAGRHRQAHRGSRKLDAAVLEPEHRGTPFRQLATAVIGRAYRAREASQEAERLLVSAYRERKAARKKTGKYRFSEPHGGEFALGGGRIPGRGGHDTPSASHHDTAAAWLKGSTLPHHLAEKFQADMGDVLGKMPPACRGAALEAISAPGGGMHFHEDIKAVTAALETSTGKKERGKVGGWVEHREGGDAAKVHLDGGVEGSANPETTAQGIYAHELGHAVDVGRKYSSDPKWESAWKREIFNGKTLLSRYARESPTEGWAELHRALVQKGVDATSAKFPKCCAYLKSKGLI